MYSKIVHFSRSSALHNQLRARQQPKKTVTATRHAGNFRAYYAELRTFEERNGDGAHDVGGGRIEVSLRTPILLLLITVL
jgi:hypothetical protein